MGYKLLNTVASDLRRRLPAGTDYQVQGLSYPAVAVGDWKNLTGDYFRSVSTGVQQLRTVIRAEFAGGANANEQIVLVGYSQGAHVIGNLLSNGNTGDNRLTDAELSHIKAVVLFADPRYNEQERFALGGAGAGLIKPKNGILGARALGDLSRVASSNRIRSFARVGDPVCQWFNTDKTRHDQDGYYADYGDHAAAFAFSKLGFPKPPTSVYGGKLDVAFVIDTTGSMGSSIDSVKGAVNSFAARLQTSGSDFQLGLVEFKDGDQGDPFAARLDLGFTADVSSFQTAVSALWPDGGGDTPEYALSGINTAIQSLSWRNGAKKTIIVMTDAPYKDPEPVGGLATAAVLQAAFDLDPAQIYPVVVGGWADPSQFQALADGSGGTLYSSDDPTQAADAIAQVIEQSIVAPVAALSSSSPARPGDTVAFNAGGSYDPSGDEITSYEWDFDGDGTIDETTASPKTSHVYPVAFVGTAVVTVHSPAGTASAWTAIAISADAPRAPGAVGVISGDSSTPGALAFHWQSPTEDGGSPLLGYQVLISARLDADPIAVEQVGTSALSYTLSGLATGEYLVSVSALNDVGAGPTTTATLVVANDTTPPTTTASGADTCWHRRAVVVTFTACDNEGGSGVAKTEYKLDAGAWKSGTSCTVAAPGDHSMDGSHTISYRSTDAAGNTETAKQVTVRIDTTTPAGSFALAAGAATTTTTSVSGDSSVADAHGPLDMRFSLDGKATWSGWQAYAASVALSLPAGNGAKTVHAQYRDAAGNVLELSDAIELVPPPDTVAPTVQASGVTEGSWHRTAVAVTLTATDPGSGVAAVTYALDGVQTTVPGSLALVSVPALPNAHHTLTYHATDVAANSCTDQTLSFTIDTAGPTTTGRATSGRMGRSIALRCRVTDNLSPQATSVRLVVKTLRGKKVSSFSLGTKQIAAWYSVKWKPRFKGTYRYYVYAKDLAGNAQSRAGSASVVVR